MAKTSKDLEEGRKGKAHVLQQFGSVPTSVWDIDYSWGKSTLELDNRKQTQVAEDKHKKMSYNLKKFETLGGEQKEINQILDAFDMSSLNVRGKGSGVSTFPPDLCRKITNFYSEEGETVLDCCHGHASRVETVHKLNRHYIGYDICYNEFTNQVKEKLLSNQLFPSKYTITLRNQSSEKMEELDNSIDLIFTSPPYFSIEFYSDDPRQIGYNKTYEEFLAGLKRILAECYRVLKPGKICAFNVNDFRMDGKFYMFHADTARLMQEVGFKLHDIIIIVWGNCMGAAFANQVWERKITAKRNEFLVVGKKV